MKRFGIIALFAALVLLAACSQALPDDAYVVGFYNVENLFDTEHDPGNRNSNCANRDRWNKYHTNCNNSICYNRSF